MSLDEKMDQCQMLKIPFLWVLTLIGKDGGKEPH